LGVGLGKIKGIFLTKPVSKVFELSRRFARVKIRRKNTSEKNFGGRNGLLDSYVAVAGTIIFANGFSGRRIIEAKFPEAGRRVQCGAQPFEASKTLTRRAATYNRPLIRAHSAVFTGQALPLIRLRFWGSRIGRGISGQKLLHA
jgi:hypothetical protein